MQLTYQVNEPVNAEEVVNVFRSSGIKRPIDDIQRIENMLQMSNLIVTVRDHTNQLVGIARSLTDFCYCCYVSDLAVSSEYQKAGIGKALLEHTQKEIGDQCSLVLLSAPSAMEYYPKIGFQHAHHAFFIPRKH